MRLAGEKTGTCLAFAIGGNEDDCAANRQRQTCTEATPAGKPV